MDRKESRDHHNSRKRRHGSPSRSPSRPHSKSHVKSKQIKEDVSLNMQSVEHSTGIHSKFMLKFLVVTNAYFFSERK